MTPGYAALAVFGLAAVLTLAPAKRELDFMPSAREVLGGVLLLIGMGMGIATLLVRLQ